MIFEAIITAIALGGITSGTTVLGYHLGRRDQKAGVKKSIPVSKPIKKDDFLEAAHQEVEEFLNPPPPKETVPWSYNYVFGTTKCTKCKGYNRWKGKGYTICACKDHPQPHFHITCPDCQYKVIMRSADDVK